MNKRRVDELIPKAYEVLTNPLNGDSSACIVKDGKISGNFRGQISSFGAAISTGSLLAAVAFFSNQGSAEVQRQLLISAIERLLEKESLFDYVKNGEEDLCKKKEEIVNAAIALKLAMNFFELREEDNKR